MGNDIKITILGSGTQGECEVGCGEDWSSLESLKLASDRIKEKFDTNIQLEYIDLSENRDSKRIQEWNDMVKSRNLSLPLLLVDGEVRISGQFDMRQLMDVIEIQMEVGSFR